LPLQLSPSQFHEKLKIHLFAASFPTQPRRSRGLLLCFFTLALCLSFILILSVNHNHLIHCFLFYDPTWYIVLLNKHAFLCFSFLHGSTLHPPQLHLFLMFTSFHTLVFHLTFSSEGIVIVIAIAIYNKSLIKAPMNSFTVEKLSAHSLRGRVFMRRELLFFSLIDALCNVYVVTFCRISNSFVDNSFFSSI
jgi:hypothetical protein